MHKHATAAGVTHIVYLEPLLMRDLILVANTIMRSPDLEWMH